MATPALARGCLEDRQDDFVRRAGDDCALHDDDVVTRLFCERLPDLLCDLPDERQIDELAVKRCGRRDKRQLRVKDRAPQIQRRPQRFPGMFRQQRGESLFVDRRFSRVDRVHLRAVDVYAGHIVALLSEADAGHETHVPGSDDGNARTHTDEN